MNATKETICKSWVIVEAGEYNVQFSSEGLGNGDLFPKKLAETS